MGRSAVSSPAEIGGGITEAVSADRVRGRRWPFICALALMFGVLVIGITQFPDAPDPMPVHFDGALQPDRWAPKSVGGFLMPAFMGLGVLLLLWTLSALLPLAGRLGGAADGSASGTDAASTGSAAAVQLSPRQRQGARGTASAQRMLEHLSLGTAVLIGAIAVASWLGVPAWLAPWLLPVLLTAYFALLIVDCVRVVRAERSG